MAENVTLVANLAPDVTAFQDFRAHQYKAVNFGAAGVKFSTAAVNSGPCYVLGNKPNSGEACELVSQGNVTKAIAGDTVARNNWITVTASAYFVAGSDGSAIKVGVAWSAAASGYVFNLQVR